MSSRGPRKYGVSPLRGSRWGVDPCGQEDDICGCTNDFSGSFVVNWWWLVVILWSFDGLLVIVCSHPELCTVSRNNMVRCECRSALCFPILTTLGLPRCHRSGWLF